MKELFVKDLESLEELEYKYNLEDCGMSGQYYGWHWYCDDEEEVNAYFKLMEE